MTKFRDMFKKVYKESTLKEYQYDPEYDEIYPEGDEVIPHDDQTYTDLKVKLQGHEALLTKLQELGYTKESNNDPIILENGEAYILVEDALVTYMIDVEDKAEYVSEIYSISAPRIHTDEKGLAYPDSDDQVDITSTLLPEDVAKVKDGFNQGGIELNGPDETAELRSDYYHSVL